MSMLKNPTCPDPVWSPTTDVGRDGDEEREIDEQHGRITNRVDLSDLNNVSIRYSLSSKGGWGDAGHACASWVVLVVTGPVLAGAQVGSGSLAGRVVDQAGAPVPGATVTAIAAATNLSRTSVTGRDGAYVVAGLPPGTYRLRMELSGFRPLTREGIRLATGETVRVDAQLQVGAVSESVTVPADAPLLRSDTSSLGHVIDNRRIVDLPLNGRSFLGLVTLAPGVAVPPPPAAPFPRINGGRPRTNEYLFDGISVLQPEPGQVSFLPNVDAIQEFKIESNSPPAEFGRFNGGVINLTTKSGGNALRGSVFEFARHESMNARNFFAPAGAVKPQFRRNQFGGVVGGPIRRDRTFFFFDYQGQRQTIGRTVISTVPTAAAAARDLHGSHRRPCAGHLRPGHHCASGGGGVTRSQFANNTIPAGRMDPVARNLLERYPLPTSAGRPTTTAASTTRRSTRISSACDWTTGSRRPRSVFGRLTRFDEEFIPVTPLPDGSGADHGHARAAEHHVVLVCLELSARVLERRAQRASSRRHPAYRRPGRRTVGRHGIGRPRSCLAFPPTPSFQTRSRRSPLRAIPSSGPRSARPRISEPA